MNPTTGDTENGSRYVGLGRIASGGMAEVHVAYREGAAGFRKLVAVKRVLPHFAHDPNFERMFLNEARLAAGLDHSNLAGVLDFGVLGGRYFLAMEYVHGHDLRAALHRAGQSLPDGVLPLECSLYIVQSVAAGLHYAHERCDYEGRALGLVHRDISPSNILLSYEGEVKLTDFGIAKATTNLDATATNALRGKLAYMSPEHARGGAIDRRSDIFALGIVLFELTTGYRQFTGENQYQLLNRVAAGEVTMPRELVPDYPRPLQAIVARALAADPAQRYQSALEFYDALGDFAATRGLRLEGPRLGRTLVSLFGERPMPTPDDDAESTIPFGPASRPAWPESDTDTPPPPQPRSRGRWIAAVSMVAGIALGITIAQAISGSEEAQSVAPVLQPAAALPVPAAVSVAAPPAPGAANTEPAPEVAKVAEAPEPRRRRTKPKRAKTQPSPPPKPKLDDWALPQK